MRILLSFLFIFVLQTKTFAQCIPDTSLTGGGLYPDSSNGLASGMVGQAYTQDIQIVVPTDTLVELAQGVFVTINLVDITLVSINGLPPGLTYTCNPSSCVFPASQNSCALISGTPLNDGIFPITTITLTEGVFFGQPVFRSDTVTYYQLVVLPLTSGIDEEERQLHLAQNVPNPFKDKTRIQFYSDKAENTVFRVYNLIGKEVYRHKGLAEAGMNEIEFEAREFAPGVYTYTLESGGLTRTRRMVISGNK